MGTLYSVNITPDPETGIGGWPKRAFVRAMREGVNAKGQHLYPAFPYTHFTKLNDADVSALYAFLMTRAPVRAPKIRNELLLPFRFRPILAGWKLLFLRHTPVAQDTSKSTAWNRGKYIVEALAHCGACHTPRNIFFAEKRGSAFAGGETEGWHAPALNAQSPAPLPWTRDDFFAYLRKGFSPNHGLAAGPMSEVSRSLAHVPEVDVVNIATYMATVAARPELVARERAVEVSSLADQRQRLTAEAAGPPRKAGSLDLGAALYRSACARCHEPQEGSMASIAQPLALSTVLNTESPENVVQIILEGIDGKKTAAPFSMPPFRDVFDQNQVKLLVIYLRSTLTREAPWTNVDSVVHKLHPAAGVASGK
jgi:mono/diheme cytochrome c family protein